MTGDSARAPALRHRARPSVAAVAMFLALAGVTTGCTSGSSPASNSASTTQLATTQSSTKALKSDAAAQAVEKAYVGVVSRVRPEVVEISTSSGLGSGVVFDTKGDIVTNAHVVGSATTFTVQTSTGQHLQASLVGSYPADDLAVIRAQSTKGLTPATFGDSARAQVGDIVFAIGNPLGLASSVTDGIISYNGRAVSEGNGVTLPSTLQTSAAINPGNSGGALANLSSEVIGIPTLAAVDQQEGGAAAGIGFAIPSNTVKLIAPQLIANGKVSRSGRAALGISASDAVDQQGNPAGVLVVSTVASGSAAKAGIVAGDVITAVNGSTVTSLADLQSVLAQLTPGTTASVTVRSQSGSTRSVQTTLGELPG